MKGVIMDKFKLRSESIYGKSCYDVNVLKDAFLHGKTHADMSIFPIVSHDIVSSYDKGGIIDMMFFSNVCYHTYSVVFTYICGEEIWREYLQLTRTRWTARETKAVWCELHDAIKCDACDRVTARVYECELDQIESAPHDMLMRFTSTALYSHYPELPVSDRANGMRVRKWYLAR